MPIKITQPIALTVGLLALGATLAAPVQAEMSAEQLAKMAQNPIVFGIAIAINFGI